MDPSIFNRNPSGPSDSDIEEVNTDENLVYRSDDKDEFINIDRRHTFLTGLTFLCWKKYASLNLIL